MSTIHFIGGEKGGIGKSVLARLLAQYHIDKGRPFSAFDTDRSHGALLRFYGEFSQPMDLDDFESADRLMEAALDAERDILVDLAAQTALPLHRWIQQTDMLALARNMGVRVIFWHVLDDGADGIALLNALFDRYGPGAGYVVVKNYGRGKNFSAYEASTAHARSIVYGARVMDLPELHATTMRRIDHEGVSLWAAAQGRQSGLGMMDRQRVRVWSGRVYQQLDRLAGDFFALAGTAIPAPNEEVTA